MRDFFGYYKWHLMFAALFLICIAYLVFSVTVDNSPDLVFGYVGTQYVNKQTFDDFKPYTIELLLADANNDGKKTAVLVPIHGDIQSDIDEAFEAMVEEEQYNILITTKKTFKNLKDKSRFVPADTYYTKGNKDLETLKTSKGVEYAVSLKNNKFAENMGFLDPSDLFIAVRSPEKGKDPTTAQKNGRNVTSEILNDD